MINEHDINDMWDKESQEAYLKWAKEYGVQHEPWIGQPAVSAAWIAAVKWLKEQNKPLTDEQIRKASLKAGMQEHYMDFHSGFIRFARAIEDVHGIQPRKDV